MKTNKIANNNGGGNPFQHALEIFAVPPHNILDARFAGTAALIRDGAMPVFSYIDIVRTLMKISSLSDYLNKILGENK